MGITNYGELKTAIADFLNRDDLTSVIPTFVALAEADMLRDQRMRSWRSENRATSSISDRYSALPSDFQEMIRFNISTSEGWERLTLMSQADMADKRSFGDTAGKPAYYAITAGEIELFPTPDEAYTTELVYHSRFTELSADADYNWVLTYFPDAYLYGSLLHTAPYLSDDNRIAVWASLYQAALDAIQADTTSSKYGGTGMRIGAPR